MKIEFLYFEGCASYKPALERLQKVLAEENIKSGISTEHINNLIHPMC